MNSRIKELHDKLDLQNREARMLADRASANLQLEYNKVFDKDSKLAKAIANAENASCYQVNECGEVESWYRYPDLADIPEEARPYFETWLAGMGAMGVDWKNDALLVNHGESIMIQDDVSRDNGVWLAGKCIVAESEYLDTNGDVDATKRNALIEAYMERTGYFPGVFRVSRYGDVSFVRTNPKPSASNAQTKE